MAARWTEQEWKNVCLEIYRTQPVVAMTSKDLKELHKENVIGAMERVLPKDRWHASMNMTHVRPRLRATLDKLRVELQRIESEQTERNREAEERERIMTKARSRVDVFAPLVEVMAEKLFARLQPMMEEYINVRLNGQAPAVAFEDAIAVHKPKAPDKLKVGVIGLLPIQEEEIKKRFPYLNLTFYDKDKSTRGVKQWANGLDAVFGLIAKMSHNPGIESWEKYYQVPGRGVTSVIRSIEVWLASRGIKVDGGVTN